VAKVLRGGAQSLPASIGEPLEALAHSPWAVRNQVPLTLAGNTRLVDAVENVLATGRGSTALADVLARSGVGQLLDTVTDVKAILNPGLEVFGILPTMFDGRSNHARAVLADVGERYGLPVLSPPIPKTVRFAEAPAVGRSILTTSRRSKGAQAYRDVAASLLPLL